MGVSSRSSALTGRSEVGLAERSPGRPGAGPAWRRGQLLSSQTATHPQCLQCTAAAWLHYKGASQQHKRRLRCQWLRAVLGLYFTSVFATALQAQARFYGIQSISLNGLVVLYWPDSTFPDLDYKRKTASGRFKCRSVDMLYQSSSAEHGNTRAPPGPIPWAVLSRHGLRCLLEWLPLPFTLRTRCYHIVNIVFNIAESFWLVFGLKTQLYDADFLLFSRSIKQHFSRRFPGRKRRYRDERMVWIP